jgi:DNA-binding MarR family transcriptional regulator
MNKTARSAAAPRERVRLSFCEELMATIGRLQREFMRFHAQFEFGELSRLHMGILGVLRRNGEMPVSAIGDLIHTSRPQMTMLLDKLEASGLVSRGADPADRRVTTVSMTPRGQEVLSAALGVFHRDVNVRLEVLTDDELQEFKDALGTIQRVLEKL